MAHKADFNEPFRNIALSGRSGSGKTTVADYLVSRYRYTHCKTGQAVRHVGLLLFDSDSKSILNHISDAMRGIDENVWLRAALKDQSPPIVFDSVRSKSEYLYLKDRGFHIWRVESVIEQRITRLRLRGQEFDPVNDESHLTETDLDNSLFDRKIINSEEDLATLYSKVDEAMLLLI